MTIYVALIGEGVEVWRPVEAELRLDGHYRIVSRPDPTADWQFPLGAVVRCAAKTFSDGERGLVAVERVTVD